MNYIISNKNREKGDIVIGKKKIFFVSLKNKPLIEKCLKTVAVATIAFNLFATTPQKTSAYVCDYNTEISKSDITNPTTNENYSGTSFEFSSCNVPILKFDIYPEAKINQGKYKLVNASLGGTAVDPYIFERDEFRVLWNQFLFGFNWNSMDELEKARSEHRGFWGFFAGSGASFDFFHDKTHKLSLMMNGKYSIGIYGKRICNSDPSQEVIGEIKETLYRKEALFELTYCLFGQKISGFNNELHKESVIYWIGISPFVNYSEEKIGNETTINTRYGLEFKFGPFFAKAERDSNRIDRISMGLLLTADSFKSSE